MAEQLFRGVGYFNIRGQPQKVVHYVKAKPASKIRARYRGDMVYLGATSGQLQLIPVKTKAIR